MLCPAYPSPQFFIYTDQIPPLIYYSHFSVFAVLILGIFVYFQNRSLPSKILFYLSFAFLAWTALDLVTWTNNDSDVIMFAWSLLPFAYSALVLLCVYLSYAFMNQKDMPFSQKLILGGMLLPVILVTPTAYNLKGFDLDLCGAAGFESNYVIYYKLLLGLVAFVWILNIFFQRLSDSAQDFKKQLVLFIIGIELFLLSLFTTEFVASYLANGGLVDDFSFTQYGFFAMTFFMGVLSYMIVKFKAFNAKLLATQALVWTLLFLIGSQFLFIKVFINYILTAITFLATFVFGNFLIHSVKIEIQQREQLAVLLKERENLEHLISHKVKGSFTRSKFVFAEMLDGSFGELPEKAREMAQGGLDANNSGIKTVDLILNSFNLQAGAVKFEMNPLDLKSIVEEVAYEKRPQAEAKGLEFSVTIDEGRFEVIGDAFWLKEVVNNLVENSIRYTLHGFIKITLANVDCHAVLSVSDSGVGITSEDMANLFKQGGRGKNSVKVNTDSTGYGLYSVKMILDAHHGSIEAKSEGEGKGSTFSVKLDLAP